MTAVRWPRTLQDVAAGRLSREALDAARLMVSELVTNSVRHGGANDGMTLDLSVALLPSVLHRPRRRIHGVRPAP